MIFEHPEDRRARRLAAVRAERGTPVRLRQIAELEEKRRSAATRSNSSTGRKTPENSADLYGHPWPEWFTMRDAVLDHIEACARRRSTTTYGAVWNAVTELLGHDPGNRHRKTPNLLGYVGQKSLEEYELLATALVVYDEEPVPGPGFFRLAGSLRLMPPANVPEEGEPWRMTAEQERFWREHLEGMFERFSENGRDDSQVAP